MSTWWAAFPRLVHQAGTLVAYAVGWNAYLYRVLLAAKRVEGSNPSLTARLREPLRAQLQGFSAYRPYAICKTGTALGHHGLTLEASHQPILGA